jgi:pimeloyl-ACP methyl ester carboxylesterase
MNPAPVSAGGKAGDLKAMMAMVYANARYVPGPLVDQYFADYAGCSEQHIKGVWADLCTALPAETLEGITVPTLVTVGDRDMGLRGDIADGARIPGSALHVFYRSNHLVYLDRPAEFAAILEDFIGNGIPAATASPQA